MVSRRRCCGLRVGTTHDCRGHGPGPGFNIWTRNLATPDDIDVYVDIEDHDIDVCFDIEYSNFDIDVTVFDIVVTKKTSISTFRDIDVWNFDIGF